MNKTQFSEKVLEAEQTLYRISKTILEKDADCEDAVSEAILKAYEKLDTLKEEKYFKTWLVRILINECYQMRRSQRPLLSYEEYYTDTPAKASEDYSDLHEAIRNLPPHVRITIVLYYVEGYKVNDIKTILDIPSGTVKSRLSKGRKLLKKQLIEMEVTYGLQ